MNQLLAALFWGGLQRLQRATLWLLRVDPAELREDPREPPGDDLEDQTDPQTRNWRRLPSDQEAELVLAALLVAAGLFAVVFILLYAFDDNNQLLGLSLGLALACAAAGLILAGKRVTPPEQLVEGRPQLVHQ